MTAAPTAALAALVGKWQPIESVPRDDTQVLLCWTFADGVRPDIRIGRFFFEIDGSLRFKIEMDMGDFCASAFTGDDYVPTHWMPLPAAPTPGEPT